MRLSVRYPRYGECDRGHTGTWPLEYFDDEWLCHACMIDAKSRTEDKIEKYDAQVQGIKDYVAYCEMAAGELSE